MRWNKLGREELRSAVFEALGRNTSYHDGKLLGVPGSFLDREVFPDAPFLDKAPFLRCMLENPNHIGCHTLGEFEPMFRGTQALERELMAICAEQIMGAAPDSYDGYVASGGTEANLQAMWIYRNLFRREHGARTGEVGVLYSADTHYSVAKGCDILDLVPIEVPVDGSSRRMQPAGLADALRRATEVGVRFVIVVANMGTTMFGSVDPIDPVVDALAEAGLPFRLHVDAAFGGFVYPFTTPDHSLSFRNEHVSSITMDAHKMLQAPYGTGIFLVRKGLMGYVQTEQARYVPGTDFTVCGSRSGANAVAIWMILRAYGSEGGRQFVTELVQRTDELCERLRALGVRFFREPGINVVALRAADVPTAAADEFQLVPDSHAGPPAWWKVVVMDHVGQATLDAFVTALGTPSRT